MWRLVVLLLLAVPATAEARMPPPPQYTVKHSECPYYAERGESGVTCADLATGTVWLAHPDRFSLEHEKGHLFDAQVLTDQDRAHFTRLLRLSGPWDQGTGEGAGRGPSEVFADAYAYCATGWTPVKRSRNGMLVGGQVIAYGYFPSVRRYRRVCFTIQFFGWYRAYQSAAS
jgi:hypothetical protein